MLLRFVFLILLVFTAQVSFSQQPGDGQREAKGYLIGPGDEITAKVLGEQQFDFVATVDQDGRIEVPFFETPIDARCRTERELRAEVSKLLSKYLKNPEMSLRVTGRNSRPPVNVYGEVREPQQFDLKRRARLLELIAFAGGLTEKSGGMIQVFRTRPPMCADPTDESVWRGEGLNVPSKLYKIADLRQGDDAANPEIFPGDIVIAQKAAPVFVVGEVMRPGELSIPDDGLRLMQAVAMASGITREAKTKIIKIYRRKPGTSEPDVIAVNYELIKAGKQKDVILQAFDIVEVDKSRKSVGDVFLEFVTGVPNRVPLRPIY